MLMGGIREGVSDAAGGGSGDSDARSPEFILLWRIRTGKLAPHFSYRVEYRDR